MKCNIADEIQFSQAAMMRVINKKMLPLVGKEPNIIEDTAGGVDLKVFWHSFQVKKRCYFFWITAKVEAMPPLMPSTRNAVKWEEDCVLKRLFAGGRAHALEIDMTIEPEPKQMKVASSETTKNKTTINNNHVSLNTAEEQSHGANATISSRWESGDARKLFAPCTVKYDINECVREIAIERIELLESVNGNGKNWTNVVEPATWNVDTCPYSESDVFTLQLKSIYLVSALRQFVLNVTDDLTTQWTWKSCLLFAIEAMIDVGTEYYSKYRTLARCHRKLPKHRLYFCKAPEAKTRIPHSFATILTPWMHSRDMELPTSRIYGLN
jgi:hypothetical protein